MVTDFLFSQMPSQAIEYYAMYSTCLEVTLPVGMPTVCCILY